MTTPDELRTEIETFFADVLPDALDGVTGSVARAKAWRSALFDAGLAGLDYPVELGGRGLDREHMAVWRETTRGRIPREDTIFGLGVGMAVPTIRDHGTEALAERFVRPGLRGEEIWCQMYSEPGAGSDLAGLTTRAIRDGDEWIVTGQKVWTSNAHHADLAVLLARTDWDAPKHAGISMFVLPMDQPGVDVRPLVMMTGEAEFNEIFLDEARIPADWVIGEVNGGWSMAVALLAHERRQTGVNSMQGDTSSRSRAGRAPMPFGFVRDQAERHGRLDDPVIRQDLARLHSGERIVSWLGARGAHPSLGKLWRTRQGRLAAEVAMAVTFSQSLAWSVDPDDEGSLDDDHVAFQFLNGRGMSLGGGTDEIQRNTLGERVLGLPREPGPGRNTPFNELPRN